MKKRILLSGIVLIALLWVVMMIGSSSVIYADWWERPTGRPTQPSDYHPTFPPEPTNSVQPTNPPEPTSTQPTTTQPSPTPRVGGPTEKPPTGRGSTDDPCGSGKSYTGEYCGWSPRVGGGEGGKPSESQSIVRGLSKTASFDLGLSDIILLSGVLCLLLYVKSKFGNARA